MRFALYVLAALVAVTARAACPVLPESKPVFQNRNGHTKFWTIPNDGALLAAAGNTLYPKFSAWIEAKTKLNAREILINQVSVFRKGAESLDPKDAGRAEMLHWVDDEQNVIDGKLGKIRSVSCVEAALFEEMLTAVDLTKHPSELSAFVYLKGDQLRIVGDFYRSKDGESPFIPAVSDKERKRLAAEGWQLFAHLHSHPFMFDNPYGDIGGATMPSEPDVKLYLESRPAQGWITNGRDTIEIRADEYSRF